jgi:hypothetical protein
MMQYSVPWLSCHHDTARPLVADGSDDLQIWRVVANICNKQQWTTEKELSFSLGVAREG